MKGIVLEYLEDTKIGYISGDDNNRYEFTFEDWLNEQKTPQKGLKVSFDIDENNRAINIYSSLWELPSDKIFGSFLQDNKNLKKVYLVSLITLGSITTLIIILLGIRLQKIGSINNAVSTVENLNLEKIPEDLDKIKEAKKILSQSLDTLNNIPNYPFFPYNFAQEEKKKLETQLQNISNKEEVIILREKEAKDNFSLSLKSAMRASEIVENPPHSAEVWQEAKTEWESAINYLQSAPENASLQKDIDEKIDTYITRLETVEERLKQQETAENNFKSAINNVNSAIHLTKSNPNSLTSLQESAQKWETAISLLYKVPTGTTLSEEAKEKIPEYQKNLSALKSKINQLENQDQANSFIDDFMATISSYSYKPFIDDVKYWCSSALQNQSSFENTVENYVILWRKINSNSAVYRIRIEGKYTINDYTLYLSKKSSGWCITQFD